MRQLFISYARENKPDVEALVRDLDALGHQTWVDSSLRGGQTWWDEILRRIADSDVFVAIISQQTLNSVACKRELEWALALNKPVLPLAVERLPDALPRALSMRQIVTYTRSGREAAFALAGALGTLPAAPPPPEQLPEPPPAPLSYLSDLVEQVGQPEPLTHEQQRQIVIQLQPALRSADSEERRGGRYVLEMFSTRDDLYADVDRSVAQLGLTDRDAQRPVAPEAPEDSHDEHALITPEVPAEGKGNLLADPQWADALSAFFAKRWPEAVQRFEALEARYPGEDRVKTRLTDARRQRDIDAWSSKAESAAADDDWDTVVTALENLTGLDANYPDAAARLEQARIAQRCKALVDEMTALHQAGRWQAVVAAAEELARLDPDHPDPGGIVSDAQAKIRDADLADRYAQALNHLDQEHWQQAAELFTAIEQQQPGFRDAAALLTTAQRQRDLAAWSDQAAAAAGQDDWDAAVAALEKICAVDPTHQDAGVRLEQARSAKRLRTLVDEVTALHQAGRWNEVVAAAKELGQLDPDHPDPGGMISDAQAKIRDNQLAERYAQGLEQFDRGHWQHAIDLFAAIEQEQPGYPDVAGLLTKAQRQRELAAWSDQAAAAAENDDWDAAVTALENLTGLDPAYPDASARLEQARTAQRRKAHVDEMTALHQAGRWEAVVAAAQELARVDPDNPDPGGIVSDAHAKIRDARLAERYAQARNHLDQEDWQQAADLLAAIEQEQPGYPDVAGLLTKAQRQRELAAWSDQAAAAAGKDDWDAVVAALENICGIDPAYRDAGARLQQARSAQRHRSLVEEVTALHQAGRWNEVVAAAKELAQLDPDHPDPSGMVSDARANLRDAELADRYAQGVNYLNQAFFDKAVAVFTDIEQEHPGFRDAASRLMKAQQRRDLAAWDHQAEVATRRQDWATATSALEKICAIDPTYRRASARMEEARSAQRGRGEAPLSLADRPLTDLDALMDSTTPLSREQQHQILDRLQAGLRSDDREQRIAQRLLGSFRRRDDLYQDIAVTAASLLDAARRHAESPDVSQTHEATTVSDDSHEAAAAELPSSDTAALAGRSNAPTSGSPTTTEDRPTAGGKPTDTTPTPLEVPFFQRLNRRTKIVLAVGLAFAVVAVAVVIIVANRPGDATRRLKALVGDNCSPEPTLDSPAGAVASVVCWDEGPGGAPYYHLFHNQAALDSYYNSLGSSPQPCPGMGSSPQNWHRAANPQHTEGKVDCVVSDDGTPVVSWTVDSQLLFGSVSGPQGGSIDQVYQWWANRYQV
jgi:outer membrane protein assembly factor BamD (BamD/ComL family)